MFEVKKEILDSHEAMLEVVVEPDAVESAKRAAARKISQEINIPGFRKGKAPYAKVSQYVGESAIVQEAAEQLLDEHYADFLDSAEVSAYGPGDFVDMTLSPLTFKLRVPLEPVVELGDYRSLRLAWEDPTIPDEELNQVLEQVREENAVLEPIDSPAELGNELRITVIATVDGDEVVHEHDIPVVLSEARPFLSPEFIEALLGVVKDEKRDFTITLPETLEEPSLRGQEAAFHVEVEQVYDRQLPGLDDALASAAGSFETFDELVQDIRNRMLTQKRQQTESMYQGKLVSKLVEQAEMRYPPRLVEDTLDDMVASISRRVESQQKMSLEDALRLQGRTMEQYRDELRPQAEVRAREVLALRRLADLEAITTTDDDVRREYRQLFAQMGWNEQKEGLPDLSLNMEDKLAQNLRASAFERKVYERLIAIGRGALDREQEAYIADTPEDESAEDAPEANALAASETDAASE